MAGRCRCCSSEPSSAQILYQIGQLLKLLLHLPLLALIKPLLFLAAFFSSFTLSSSDEI